MEKYILAASGKARPRVCFVPTASGDEWSGIERFFEVYTQLDCSPVVLHFFRRTPSDLRAFTAACDVLHVGGGNTRSMLAVWRHWGFDAIVREAYASGTVLCGASAGAICWFEEGVTDSVAGPLTRMSCLGLLSGSNCPHYDGEKERRPAFQRMVAEGEIGSGYACDDGAGLHFSDESLHAVLSARPNATAYRVERNGSSAAERALEAKAL